MFKVGDKVRCTDATECGGKLVRGKVHVIKDVNPPMVNLEGVQWEWFASRFVLVTKPSKVAEPPKSGRLMT